MEPEERRPFINILFYFVTLLKTPRRLKKSNGYD